MKTKNNKTIANNQKDTQQSPQKAVQVIAVSTAKRLKAS